MWDEQAVIVSEMVRKRGNTITALSRGRGGALAARRREPVIDNLNAALKDKGLDGAKLLESSRRSSQNTTRRCDLRSRSPGIRAAPPLPEHSPVAAASARALAIVGGARSPSPPPSSSRRA